MIVAFVGLLAPEARLPPILLAPSLISMPPYEIIAIGVLAESFMWCFIASVKLL